MAGAHGLSHDASAGNQRLEGGDHRVVAFEARQHQILVESILHGAAVGYSQNRVGRLDIVSDAKAGFPLRGTGDAIALVEAHAEIEGPMAERD